MQELEWLAIDVLLVLLAVLWSKRKIDEELESFNKSIDLIINRIHEED